MIRLAAALLCDAANVRENLLSVLGGGVTTLGRADFPAPINCDLALSFYVSANQSGFITHQIEAIGSSENGEQIFAFETGFSTEVVPSTTQTVSIVLPVGVMGVSEPGRYRIDVQVDGEEFTTVPFTVEKINIEEVARPVDADSPS